MESPYHFFREFFGQISAAPAKSWNHTSGSTPRPYFSGSLSRCLVKAASSQANNCLNNGGLHFAFSEVGCMCPLVLQVLPRASGDVCLSCAFPEDQQQRQLCMTWACTFHAVTWMHVSVWMPPHKAICILRTTKIRTHLFFQIHLLFFSGSTSAGLAGAILYTTYYILHTIYYIHYTILYYTLHDGYIDR